MSREVDIKEVPHLPVAPGNRLILISSKNTQKHGRDDDEDYYEEVSPDGKVVAKYYAWVRMSIYPPHNQDSGWHKYDPQGNLIDMGRM